MPQPYDYSQLVGGFQSPQQAFVNQIKLRDAYIQQEKAKQDAAAMKAALQDYTTNPTPQKLANLHLNFPALKDSLTAYTQTLSDADKKTTTEFATQAFGLNRAGKPEEVLTLFDTYIAGAQQSNRPDMVKALQTAKQTYSTIQDPKAREALIASVMASTGQDGLNLYEKVWSTGAGEKPTTFQQDFNFIKNTFGDAAAAEFAQYGRSGIVSVPLGDGRTYVGPPSMVPGATRWREQPGMTSPGQPSTTGAGLPEQTSPQGASEILGSASRNKRITQAEANVVRQSLGEKGQAAFQKWLTDNNIKIVVRTGTTPDGRRVVQFQDGTVEYGAD